MKIVIVESPTKMKTISKYLGKGFSTHASMGHIRDLAKSGKYSLGVDIDGNFEATYEILPTMVGRLETLKKKVATAEEVYLATDPDREGEAISWHLSQVLELDPLKTKRLEFHEITPFGIKNALENPRTINMQTVQSQETRRILDRIIGFRLSWLLQQKIGSKSGGRVQSAVLKLVVDREREIQAFVPSESYDLFVHFMNKDGLVNAKILRYQGEKVYFDSKEAASIASKTMGAELTIKSLETVDKKVYPLPPLTTSSLQQEAFNRYHYSTKKTMTIAQELFEGVALGERKRIGLITYMRTDSIRLSPIFINQAKEYIQANFGKGYVGTAYSQKADGKVQDAHEAIRPTDLSLTPTKIKKHLTDEQFNLYSLVFNRAIASIMKSKETEVTTLVLESNGYEAEVSSTKVTFDGFTKLMQSSDNSDYQALDYIVGSSIEAQKYTTSKIVTKPPYRYSEASLVKKMEETGVGRPSTYASTIERIKDKTKGYITYEKGRLVPTQRGIKTIEYLEEYFAKVVDITYTADMEKELDEIETGSVNELDTLRKMNGDFEAEFKEALQGDSNRLIPTGEKCPICGRDLVIKPGRFGDFVGCSGFPECNYIKPKVAVTPTHMKVCPECGKGHLIVKKGRNGSFLACDRYPECRYTENFKTRKVYTKKRS